MDLHSLLLKMPYGLRFYRRVKGSPIGERLARGLVWSLAGTFCSRGLALLSSVLVARMIGKVGFGELGVIQNTIGLFGTLAGFGLGITATKFIAECRTTDPARAGRILAITTIFAWITSIGAGVVLFLIAPLLAQRVLAAPHLAGLLRISAIYLILSATTGAQNGSLAGLEAFRTMAKISLWSGLANFPLMICGAYLGGLNGAVWAMVIAMGLNWLFNHIAVRRECALIGLPYTYDDCWSERGVLWKFSLPAMVSGLFTGPTEWILYAMLVNQPGGYGQMGLFNAARQWQAIILFLPSMLSNTTIPILASLVGEGKERQYKKMLIYNSLLLTGMAMIVALPVGCFAGRAMSLYGREFSEGSVVLIYICFQAVLMASNIVVGQALWCSGASTAAMVFSAIRAALLVALFAVFVDLKARGLALAFLATYTIQTIYLIPYVWHKAKTMFPAIPVARTTKESLV